MKRLIFTVFLIFAIILSVPSESNAITYAKGIVLDGEELQMDVAPVIENGRTLVPMRGVLEAMGATVSWDKNSKTATAYLGEDSASVTINSLVAYTNGYPIDLDVPAKIINGRTMVPLRFMAEAIGYNVNYSDGWVYLDSFIPDDYIDFDDVLYEFDRYVAQPELASDALTVSTTYNEDLNAVVVSMHSEGLAKLMRKVANDSASKAKWMEFKDYMQTFSTSIVDHFYSYEFDVNGIVEIINDEDPDYVLLQFINGELEYDGSVMD